MRTRRPASSDSPSLVHKAGETIRSFSASGRVLFIFFSGLLVLSAFALLYMLNRAVLVEVPTRGGTYTEGVVGAPRFINPVLAISDADRDLTALVFSGLLKATPKGVYIPDLAESFTISPDGKTYTFRLRPDISFQDGKPVTADDVVFTTTKIQDSTLKSPERPNWSGVVVEKIDDKTISFTLKQAYTPFIENLSVGILPKHLWDGIADDEFPFSNLNTSPIGSGPFKVVSLSRTSSGVPSSYTLAAYSRYKPQAAYLSTITFSFYQNEESLIDAIKKSDVSAASGISPTHIPEVGNLTIQSAPLNRVFGIFFNQNESEVLRDGTTRKILSDVLDRNELITQILGGYGTPLTGPLPPNFIHTQTPPEASTHNLVANAKAALMGAGWKLGQNGILQKTSGTGKTAKTLPLTITLATSNVPELRSAAEYIRKTWGSLGVAVEIQVYDQGDLAQNVIRPRKYEALLFGEVIGREPDLFAFWSSSERLDPGLNIALYTNANVDKLLSKLRATFDVPQKQVLYQQFVEAISLDTPAIFLYAPDFVYIVPKDIRGLELGSIETPSDRFLSVTNWHRETDWVWPLFIRQ